MLWFRRSCILIACVLMHSPTPSRVLAQQPNLLGERAVLTLPGMASVQVDTGIVFHEVGGRALKLDFFRPTPGADARRSPLVIFVNGVGMVDPSLRRWWILTTKAGVDEATIMRLAGWRSRSMFDWYSIRNNDDLANGVRKLAEATAEDKSQQTRRKK